MINEEKRIIQLEALDALRENGYRGAVILPTGTGKSYVLVEALKEVYQEGMSVLYTCDSTLLRDVDFIKELVKWGGEDYVSLIERQCYAGACKKKDKHYNILLADEGDYALTPAYSRLFQNNTFDYIIFVSATLDKRKVSYLNKIVPIVYKKEIKEIEERKVINKSQFFYVPFLLNPDENEKYLKMNQKFHQLLTEQATGRDVGKRIEFLTFERLHFLASLKSSVYICRQLMKEIYQKDKDCRIVVFCGQTDQADKVCKYSYHDKNKELNNLEKFNESIFQALSVCGKIDRGTNLHKVNYIIMENITRSETRMIQRTGRGKRLGVDDLLYVFFLVPYYKEMKMNRMVQKPTVILGKIQEAAKNMGIENAQTYILNQLIHE